MEILKFFFGGLLIGMITLLITLGLLSRVPFRMDIFGFFWWAWIRDAGLPMLLAIPIVYAVCIRKQSPYSSVPEITACLVGVVVLHSIWHGVMQDPGFYVYRIFISPIVRIGVIAFIAWLLDRGLYWDGAPRYLAAAVSILLPFAASLLPLAYISGRHYLTWIIGAAFFMAASLLIFLDSRGLASQ